MAESFLVCYIVTNERDVSNKNKQPEQNLYINWNDDIHT